MSGDLMRSEFSSCIFNCDSISGMGRIPAESVHLILSDIPYGIGCDDWDVLHDNANSAYMGASPAQEKGGALFRHRGKPLNGWSREDRTISAQYGAFVASFAKGWLRCLVPGASALVMAGRPIIGRRQEAMAIRVKERDARMPRRKPSGSLLIVCVKRHCLT